MRRLILLLIAVLLAVAVIAGATLVERPSANPIPGEIAQLIGVLATPEGQLLEPVAVPFPAAASTVVSHGFFSLAVGHSQLDCLACHVAGVYQGIDFTCYACHADDDPHAAANGTVCSTCHVPDNWQAVSFDHSMIGVRDCAECHEAPPEHFAPPCAGCHVNTVDFTVVRFDHSMIGPQDCAACHQPPANHFPGACAACHQDTTNFRMATFTHRFPLNHGDANGQCATCHVNNNTSAYTCTTCHDSEEVREEHEKEDILEFSDCVDCHADGEKPDD